MPNDLILFFDRCFALFVKECYHPGLPRLRCVLMSFCKPLYMPQLFHLSCTYGCIPSLYSSWSYTYIYVLIFLKVKPSYSCQCVSLTLLMLYLFLYNAERDILSREVYANVRNIILKHMFITISFGFIMTSGNSLTIYYCIASVTRTLFHNNNT